MMRDESPPKQYSAGVAGKPLDRGRLRAELTGLGLHAGMNVLVHCSMRAIGRVQGGADALRDALLDVLDEKLGTLVVPAQTPSKSRTSSRFLAAVQGMGDAAHAAYLRAMPGFDAASSPSEGMGALAESVRTHPNAHRSPHPTTSFAAIGAHADLCDEHPPWHLLDEQSPLGMLTKVDARVLLLGVGFEKCTAFHLGENRSVSREREYRFKIADAWEDFKALTYDDSDFGDLGERFKKDHRLDVSKGKVGNAVTWLFPLHVAASYAERELPGLRSVR
jgi:aminoglycoside 3-N-acetyltransferase